MRKRIPVKWGGVVIICCLCLGSALSQAPHGAPPGPSGIVAGPGAQGHGDEIIRSLRIVAGFLDLSAEQSDQVRGILREAADEIRVLQDAVRELERALKAEFANEEPSVETVGQLVIEIHGARELIASANRDALEAIGNLLTEEQLAKVEAVRKAARLEPVVSAFKILGLLPPPHPPIHGEDDPAQN